MWNFFIQFIIAVALAVVSYVLMPKPPTSANDGFREAENPVAQSGKPIVKVFGTVIIKEPDVLWYGDKSTKKYEIKA